MTLVGSPMETRARWSMVTAVSVVSEVSHNGIPTPPSRFLPSLAHPGSHSFLLYRPLHQRRLSFSSAGRGSSLLVVPAGPQL